MNEFFWHIGQIVGDGWDAAQNDTKGEEEAVGFRLKDLGGRLRLRLRKV
jgi:hypothetical protein